MAKRRAAFKPRLRDIVVASLWLGHGGDGREHGVWVQDDSERTGVCWVGTQVVGLGGRGRPPRPASWPPALDVRFPLPANPYTQSKAGKERRVRGNATRGTRGGGQ